MNIELLSQIVDYGVLGLLAFMSFLTLFFWIERLLFYRGVKVENYQTQEALCLLYTSPSPRDRTRSRMPSSA